MSTFKESPKKKTSSLRLLVRPSRYWTPFTILEKLPTYVPWLLCFLDHPVVILKIWLMRHWCNIFFTTLQSFKEFKAQVNTLASLQHPNICKLIGYHARDESNERMLVYERLHHGSLDRLLFGRPEGRLMDWSTRLKVALGAAKGLAFLHDEGPFQVTWSKPFDMTKKLWFKFTMFSCTLFDNYFLYILTCISIYRQCMMTSQPQTSK